MCCSLFCWEWLILETRSFHGIALVHEDSSLVSVLVVVNSLSMPIEDFDRISADVNVRK